MHLIQKAPPPYNSNSWCQDRHPVSLMLQADWQTAADLNLFTNASGTLGFGDYFKGSWFMGTWSKEKLSRSIQWKERFAIVAAAATWGNQWQREKIEVYCDNQAIVHMWQPKSPKDLALAQLCHTLFFPAAKNSFNICLKHLLGADNQIVDALSYQQVHHFKLITSGPIHRLAPCGILHTGPLHTYIGRHA